MRPVLSHRLLRRAAACLALCAALVAPAPAAAIIDGQPDTAHGYVGTLVADMPGYGAVPLCSGTLVSATSFVTAGHCLTNLDGARLLGVSFELDPFFGSPPIGLVGIADYHVFYPGFAVPDVFKDVAVVHLATAVSGPYGALPALGSLEPLKDKKAGDATFTVVGYGWQQWVPHSVGLGVRRFTTSRLQSFQYPTSPPGKGDASTSSLLKLQKLPGTQGTVCYSDSGGPLFNGSTTNVVSAITVGGTKNCTGQHYGLRLDTMPVQSFLLSPFH
jgi:hypothetical protein